MFPLGTVLVPHAVLPLHVFEPRYRALTRDCLAGDRTFGVVLIERGSEVGGGDQRCWVGTLARIVQAVPSPDGRWGLLTVGTERLRVTRWLVDDPYPRAVTEPFPDSEEPPGEGTRLLAERLVRRSLALSAELGDTVAPFTTELSDDPSVAAWQLVALAPVGPADQQALLELPGHQERLALLATLLEELCAVLAHRLRNG